MRFIDKSVEKNGVWYTVGSVDLATKRNRDKKMRSAKAWRAYAKLEVLNDWRKAGCPAGVNHVTMIETRASELQKMFENK
jgi:hypothetical protein